MAKEIDYLELADILKLGREIIADFRVREIGLLESAVARPKTSVFGEDAYLTFAEKTAALLHSIARNHALIDGNKRLAWSAARLFCLMNDLDINMKQDKAYEMVVGVAAGQIEMDELVKILKKAIR
ncbi:MAG: type II toxin-antitoxin system death-on-curing family toxin [Actinobacteria bacterium]|nr:type II toxin-antitoxin system death-on-curing family toxin [Actinomycetota bacterium]